MINIFTFQNLVEEIGLNALKAFGLQLIRRQSAAFADLVNGELPDAPRQQDPDENPRKCPRVLQMWMLCCNANTIGKQMLYTNKTALHNLAPLFPRIVLDGNVLGLAMHYREDILVLNNVRNNENFRHAAYRQYVLSQHGRLGSGNRRVIPSCCVTAIWTQYHSPNGIYTGYQHARL
jgi:hypothetical protein